jgi:intein/homing endonuclease
MNRVLEASWRGRRILRSERRQRLQDFERARSQSPQLRLRRAVRPADRPGHIATTAHVQAAYPFVAEAGLGTRGVLIGRDVYGGPFVIDPWLLYQEGRLHDPNMLILGRQDMGKSTLTKCVGTGTQIVDPETGCLSSVDEVVERHEQSMVFSVDGAGRITSERITAHVQVGEAETLEVTLASGRRLVATPEHPLLTPGGWEPVRDLRAGDTIAVARRIPGPACSRSLSEADIDFLAVVLAEGTYRPNVTMVSFTNHDPEIVRRMRVAGLHLGFSLSDAGRGTYRLKGTRAWKPAPRGLCHCGCGEPTTVAIRTRPHLAEVKGEPHRFRPGHQMRERSSARRRLAELGVSPVKAPEKVVPDVVFQLPNDQLARFLANFWMCDGSVTKDGDPHIALASRRLVEQLQHLLLRFGMQSRVREVRVKYLDGHRLAWHLRVYGSSRSAFAERIPLWGEKARRLKQAAAKEQRNYAGLPRLAMQLESALRQLYEQSSANGGPDFRDVARVRGGSYKFQFTHLRAHGTRAINRTAFDAFCCTFGVAARFSWIWSDDLFWDPVVSIRPAGLRRVYDLAVEPTHSFIANDIVVHNTVMFRQRLFGRRIEVTDPKGEYDRLIQALGGVVLRLEPGGQIQLNPLERIGSAEQRQDLLHAVARAILARPLHQYEAVGLTAALAAVDDRAQGREVCLPDVVAELRDPSERTAGEMNVPARRARYELRDGALALHRLCSGPLRGMFDGPTNAGEATWDAPAISLNISQLGGLALDDTAIAITMICATAFLDAKRRHRTQLAYDQEREPERTIRSNDEGWRILSVPGLAEYYQRSFKLSRETGVQNVLVVHRFSDLSAVGDEGSRLQQLAEGVVSETATRVVYRQAERDIALTAEVLGLSDEEQRVVGGRLGQGEALWRLEGRSFRVRHLISSVEWPLIQTDRAMGARRSGAVGR